MAAAAAAAAASGGCGCVWRLRRVHRSFGPGHIEHPCYISGHRVCKPSRAPGREARQAGGRRAGGPAHPGSEEAIQLDAHPRALLSCLMQSGKLFAERDSVTRRKMGRRLARQVDTRSAWTSARSRDGSHAQDHERRGVLDGKVHRQQSCWRHSQQESTGDACTTCRAVSARCAHSVVGAGLGAATALAASPAGASTAHSSLPPVNASVSNTPTVNVGNLPINSAQTSGSRTVRTVEVMTPSSSR